MSVRGVDRDVILRGVGVVPGRATGRVHRWDGDIAEAPPRGERPAILAVRVGRWSAAGPFPPSATGVILDGALVLSTASTLPTVGRVPLELLEEGDEATVDGSAGTVDLPGVEEVKVVTSFLERPDGRILLLERSSGVSSFPHQWAGVSGYLEDASPREQAYREVREELGIVGADLTLAAEGSRVLAREGSRVYIVHPFRFRLRTTRLRLNWENVRAEWVLPTEIRRRPTVPKLEAAWDAVAPARARKT